MFLKASPESPPMFESRLVDAFSRTHAATVPILFGPAVAALIYWSIARAGLGWVDTGLLAGGGLLAWTLTEYWLHRTFFHWVPSTSWGARLHFLVHGVHHRWPRDKYRLVMPPAVSLSLFALFLGLFALLLGPRAWAFHAGFTLGYLAYDMIHYYVHHFAPRNRWLKALRRHHMLHHFKKGYEERHFGVSSPLWDRVFRT